MAVTCRDLCAGDIGALINVPITIAFANTFSSSCAHHTSPLAPTRVQYVARIVIGEPFSAHRKPNFGSHFSLADAQPSATIEEPEPRSGLSDFPTRPCANCTCNSVSNFGHMHWV